uniref:CUT domain-containing protein n=1 Tax=Panagrolaimus sp. PS1159 TaxID=55785 RepID=A0AC35G552_9BILA
MESLDNSDPMLCAVLDIHSPGAPLHVDEYRQLGENNLYHGRLSPHAGSIITTANAYNTNYATLTTMQALPPISTVTSSSQEKYIIIQTNGIRSRSIEALSPPRRRINQHASLTHSDSALSDCSLSTSGQSSEISQYPQDTSNTNYYHTSCPPEPSPPSADSGTSSCGSSAYGSMMPTYNLNIKYEYDVKTEDETPCDIQQSDNTSEPSYNSNNNENGQLNCAINNTATFIAVPFSSSSSSTCQNTHLIQPKVEKIVYTSCGGAVGGSGAFDAYNGDLLDSVSILEEDKLRSPSPRKLQLSPLPNDFLSNNESPDSNDDLEELNTRELAQRISSELKRYSIPQAIFAQRVLCRSQGTLSDLLRNPKPWPKLKSGRETFRRMAKWLQEPEYQRMSALRLAAHPKKALEKCHWWKKIDEKCPL